MKKIDNSFQSATSGQPYSGESFDHLQEGYIEAIDGVAKSIIQSLIGAYTTGDVVILSGCVLTGSYSGAGNPYSVTAGKIYYNGEVYDVDAVSGTISGSNVLVGTIDITYATIDPITFTDLSTHSVHQIRKFKITQATSGSGTKDFSLWKTLVKQFSMTSLTGPQNSSSGTFIDITGLTYTTPNDGITRYWIIFLKGYSWCTGSGGDGVEVQLYNSTASSQLDSSISLFQGGITTIDQRFNHCLVWFGTLPPNTQIKGRFRSTAGGGMNMEQNKLICVQL